EDRGKSIPRSVRGQRARCGPDAYGSGCRRRGKVRGAGRKGGRGFRRERRDALLRAQDGEVPAGRVRRRAWLRRGAGRAPARRSKANALQASIPEDIAAIARLADRRPSAKLKVTQQTAR